jgi:hypothetical protein
MILDRFESNKFDVIFHLAGFDYARYEHQVFDHFANRTAPGLGKHDACVRNSGGIKPLKVVVPPPSPSPSEGGG